MTTIKLYIDSVFYSYAQIFLSNKRWFGAAALLSTFLSPVVGAMGLLGVFISNSLALSLKYDKEKIKSGFYGFNGILIGSAAGFFFELSPLMIALTIIFVLLTFFISTALEHLLANVLNLPGLSIPFILTLYVFLIFLTNYDSIFYNTLDYSSDFLSPYISNYFAGYFRALAIILFQNKILSGLILAIAILFFSRVMFVNSIFAYTINLVLLKLLFPQYSSDFFLLTSFNAILVSFALGGSLILISRKTFLLLGLSTVFVIIFTGFFTKFLVNFFLPVLVLPFNFIVLATLYSLRFREEQTDFVLLYFKPGSPEENHYYHQNRKARFEKFKFMFAELPFWGEWKISQGFDGNITHRDEWKYAWDFVIEENEKEFQNKGNLPEDYYCFSTPVVSPLDGEIVKVADNIKDNKIGEFNLEENWGNSVVIDHGEGLFSQLSHLKRNTVKVKIGDKIKKGEVVGQSGNSGRSPSPHLHFQFQLTDRIGDKTYQFPFAHYLIKKDRNLELKTFDTPGEGELVRNIETHKSLKAAFNFQLGDELEFECSLNEHNFIEHWEVKVDMFNNTYIESDRSAKAYFFGKEKVFLMSDFTGEKKSALYYFYLLSLRVPLGYYENLSWEDEVPISLTINNGIRFFSEFIVMFDQQLSSKVACGFLPRENSDSDFEIGVRLSNTGKRLFSFVNEGGSGKMLIKKEGSIKEFNFIIEADEFTAVRKLKEQ